MPYPKDSYIEIRYNEDQIGPKDNLAKADIKCSSNLQLEVDCVLDIENKITLNGIFADDLVANSYLYFVISGLFNDIIEPTVTDSWVMTVYTEIDGASYHIDTIESGLDFEWLCSMPCQTCTTRNPEECLSCNLMANLTILYENYCYSECPGATYYDPVGNTCNNCNPMCAECDDVNGNICLSCNPFSDYPFLDGTTCKKTCPFGSYGDLDEAKCLPCLSPCQSCTNGPYDCNTCDVKDPDFGYFMNGDCKSECDEGYTVPIGNADLVCLPCNANCETCVGERDYCTSCKQDGKHLLSLHDNKCYSTCPNSLTIYTNEYPGYCSQCIEPDIQEYCQVCDDTCKTCSYSTNYCTSCNDGNYLFMETCWSECSTIDGFRQVNNDQTLECENCEYPCDTCQVNTDYCLTCQDGWVMFEYKCVRSCPDKYEASDGICILTGFFCPFGYVMENGNSCILDLQICEGNDILNYDKTKCIPQPDSFFPFPMLILVIILTIVITYAKCKRFPYMRWIACMISMLSIFEIVGLVCLVSLSGSYGIAPSLTLSFLALFFLLGLNLFCTMMYFFQLKNDSAFKYWEQEFEKSTTGIVFCGFFLNFKIHRMFYSRFWGKRDFEAVFSDEIMFYRSIMFSSCVYIICCIVPITIAGIFVVYYVPYGYQLNMFGTEMIIIELITLVLLLIELYKIRKHFLIKAYYKVKQDDMNQTKQYNVMAGVPGSYGHSVGIEYKSTSQSIGIMEKIINRIDNYQAAYRMGESNNVQTVKEIQDLREKEYGLKKIRRCISFTDLREDRLERDELQIMLDDEQDQDQEKNVWENFISEPSSPTATWYPKESNTKETLRNPYFHGRMQSLAKVYGTRGQFDNCYHQGIPLHMFPYKNCKMVSRTVQANVLELLGVDDLLPQYSTNIQKIKKRNDLNQIIDEEDVNEGQDLDDVDFGKGLVSKVLHNFEGFQEKKKRKTLPPARARMLPQFTIKDIQGNLDIDEDGNFIIISDGQDRKGNPILEDLDGRRVNRRGYLMNDHYQIVMRDETIVFREDEVDDDGEIPAPYCYWKKDSLGMNTDMFGANGLPDPNGVVPEQDEEEEAIDKEFQKLKNQGVKNLRYEEKIQEQEVERSVRSDDLDNSEAALAPSKQIKRLVQNQPLLYNPNDEDFITQVSRPMKPKPKGKLIPAKNLPPKSPKRSTVSVISQQKSNIMKTENDGHTSIDADFLINGNIGEVDGSFHQLNENFDDKQDNDISMNDQQINIPMSIRPQSGAPQVRKRGKSSKAKSKILRHDQQQLLLENTGESHKRDREQEILDGIEKFQEMLQRYPLKVRQSKSTNTLAGKQLNKVYGKIKMQYTKQVQIPDYQMRHNGGMETPQHMQMHRSGYKDGQCYLKNCSIHGNQSFSGSASKVFPQNQAAQGNSRLRGLSSIYQQDLRSKAQRSGGFNGGVSTFSLKSNKKMNQNMSVTGMGQQTSMQGVGVQRNASVQGGGHLTRIMAVSNDPSNYQAMDAGSYQEGYQDANSEHELDEMRVNREMNEMRQKMEYHQLEIQQQQQQIQYQASMDARERIAMAQSYNEEQNLELGGNYQYADERGSIQGFGSQSSAISGGLIEQNALLQHQNSGSSGAQLRGSLGKKNTNLLDGAYL